MVLQLEACMDLGDTGAPLVWQLEGTRSVKVTGKPWNREICKAQACTLLDCLHSHRSTTILVLHLHTPYVLFTASDNRELC